eukprot:3233909-Pyramimonas_sp.AAC.2
MTGQPLQHVRGGLRVEDGPAATHVRGGGGSHAAEEHVALVPVYVQRMQAPARRMLRATMWMLRATMWMSRATMRMLRATVRTLSGVTPPQIDPLPTPS